MILFAFVLALAVLSTIAPASPSPASALPASASPASALPSTRVDTVAKGLDANAIPLTRNAASPCPSSSPGMQSDSAAGPALMPAASATPCARSAALKQIGRVTVGRKANLVGKAISASTGTISQEQIATRPLLRPGEVLEDIPGLIISQHSGGGKANQYYLRGFQLDHGTNLDAAINGIPVNLGSHAHGQGYSDVNYLMPEMVSYVEFKKGLYFADQGDFAVAGGYNLFYRNTIAPTAEVTLGDFGYDRLFIANSPQLGRGHLLYGVEIAHDNGSYEKPDEYRRFNGVLRYSQSFGSYDFAITGMAYNGAFNSTDQIPARAIDQGLISRFGYVDPSDGGNTYRYALSAQLTHTDPNGATKFNMYGVNSYLSLISNFTYNLFDGQDYYNVTANPVTCNPAYVSCTPNAGTAPRASNYQSYCPANNTAPAGAAPHSVVQSPFTFSCGDQRHQIDKRTYYGFDVSRSFVTPGTQTTVGFSLRNDIIAANALKLSNGRVDYRNGTLSDDHITLTAPSAYVESQLRVGSKLRLTPGLRFDQIRQRVGAYDSANSGTQTGTVLDPKFAAAYAFSSHQEAYLDFGESFHSNDARGVIGVDDPQTRAPFDPTGAPTLYNSTLTRGSGEEIGYRYSTPKITTTVSAFRLLLSNELVFDGDHGTTSVGGPDVRQGIELANFYTPTNWLTFDTDLATTTARFLTDPLNQGTGVPESLAGVVSLGATVDTRHYAASIRMRYFGPRQLDTQGDAKSPPSTTFNTQFTAKLSHRANLTLDVFNILNSKTADVTYYYGSWLKSDAANPVLAHDSTINPALGGNGVNDYHLHPSQARTVRLTYSRSGI